MAGSSLMDALFQRSLEDLIKGLRLAGAGEPAFVAKAMDEIRREIRSTDADTKCNALQKLSYLSALHFHDMSFAAFHVVELMSSTRLAHKRVAYAAASQSFAESTPVLVLITHQLRKDLSSMAEPEVSLALECLSRIATLDLARDLSPEIFSLLGSSKIAVRKKAIAVTLRVFEKYPDSARVCFKRLVENLENSDPGILSAVVGVFCELAGKDPRSYLPLAPEFYKILVDSKNNWVLIKVVKIFAKLAALEPRLANRVVEPICDHMRKTGAKSLVFECVRTVVSSFGEYDSAVRLAVERIREFLAEDDPNLKYLALHALSIAATRHPWAVLENKEVVIKSLSDLDTNIKLESLRLVMAMVSESNVAEISRVLLNYAMKSDPVFCNEILGSILSTCCGNVYEIIVDFDWYVSLLGDIARVPHCQKGDEIERQLVDIGMRVSDSRPELVRVARDLLMDPALLGNPFMHPILSGSAWVSGKYVEFSRNPLELIDALLQPRTNLLPSNIRAVYLQSVFKVLVYCLSCYLSRSAISSRPFGSGFESQRADDSENENKKDEGFNPIASSQSLEDISDDYGDEIKADPDIFTNESIMKMLSRIESTVGQLAGSDDVEVLERARNLLCFIELIRKGMPNSSSANGDSLLKSETETKIYGIIEVMKDVFSGELGPVSMTAQQRVPIPDDLELKENLQDLESFLPEIQAPPSDSFSLENPHDDKKNIPSTTNQEKEDSGPSSESTSLLSEHRKRHGLFYLPFEKNSVSGDYPPANVLDSKNNEDDLVKLTEQSLALKKKSTLTKPRPVVVRLDGDIAPLSAPHEPMADSLSEAVHEALSGKPDSSQSRLSKGKEKLDADFPSPNEDFGISKDDNPRKSKNQLKEKDENGKEGKKKSSRRHSKHKARRKTDEASSAVSPTVEIPDFLL